MLKSEFTIDKVLDRFSSTDKTHFYYTHYTTIDQNVDFQQVEMSVPEFKIYRYFCHLQDDEYVTLVNYRKITENEEVNHEMTLLEGASKYVISEAMRVLIPAGSYRTFEELKTVIKNQCIKIYQSHSNKLQEFWSADISIPRTIPSTVQTEADYFHYNLKEVPREFYYGSRDSVCLTFDKLVDRLTVS